MYKYLIIYNILLINTFIKSSTVPTSKAAGITENKISVDPIITKQGVSEGGLILSNLIPLTNKSHTGLLNAENDLIMYKEKPVQARKGVDFNSTEDANQHDKVDKGPIASKNTSVHSGTVTLENHNNTNQIVSINDVKNINIKKKPLILSHEALEITDKLNNITINENGPDIKVNVMKANSHPGMIMPIVITILVVPMFAVVGYMALKKGREAWKNRHYKRMDFLLDGMYNE